MFPPVVAIIFSTNKIFVITGIIFIFAGILSEKAIIILKNTGIIFMIT